jgi:hypothetical protein
MRKPAELAHDAVDFAEIGDAFTQHAQGLGDEAAAGVIDDEARRVLGPYGRVAHAAGPGRAVPR